MKTLADFKRALTIGSRWQLVHAYGKNSMRTVAKVRSKDIGFKLDEKDVISWLDFPKSSELKFNGEWVEFWPSWWNRDFCNFVPNKPFMKYRQI